jgi:pimeloyl-ACP methyl ester carboxylesterase/nitroreductase
MSAVTRTKRANYQAWLINEADYPHSATLPQKISFLLGYGILAPSQHNTQPWLFELSGNELVIKPNLGKLLPAGDPDNQGLYLSLGACTENIVKAGACFGLTATVTTKGETVAVTFKDNKPKRANTAYGSSLAAIKQRYSNKLPYVSKAIPEKTIKKLEGFSTTLVKVQIITAKQDTFPKLIDIHLGAAKRVASRVSFVHELMAWLRTNNTKAFDGMPGFTVGNSSLKNLIGKNLLIKKPGLLLKLARKDEQLLSSAAAIVVLSVASKGASFEKYMVCGRVLERLWLAMAEKGIAAHPMFASIQDKTAKKQLAELFAGGQPACFLRIGYASKELPHTPRAPLHSNIQARILEQLTCHPTQHQTRVGAYDLSYITAGKGDPVLLIHGANIGWPQWYLNLDALARHHKVYALDLPGAGASTRVNFRKIDFEKDYVTIVDQFIKSLGYKKIDIVGSSFGGWIAMRLAIEGRPYIRRLVVPNPIGFTQFMPAKFRPISIWPLAYMASKTALKPKRTNKNLEKFMRDVFYDKNSPLSDEFVDYFYELSKESHNVLFISRLAHFSGMRKELFLGKDLSKISVPTLVIWGIEDPLMPLSTVQKNFTRIKDVKVETLEKTGHMPPVEASNRFNELTIDFLNG